MIHAKAQRREEKNKRVIHAEARRRGGVTPAAQRPASLLAKDDTLPASAGALLKRNTSASPRLRVNPLFLFAPLRLRVNKTFSGTAHV